jgi:hypothetical protein
VILALLGLGGTVILGLVEALLHEGIAWPVALAPFFLGLALIINGIWLTVPQPRLQEPYYDRGRVPFEPVSPSISAGIDDASARHSHAASVTENTTQHLDQMKEKRGEARQ